VLFEPKLAYAQYPTVVSQRHSYLKAETTNEGHESVYLYSSFDLGAVRNGDPLVLDGDSYLLLSYNQKLGALDLDSVSLELERTKVYWMDWCTRTTPTRRYAEHVERSALVLKLLSYQKTGAILAAATTSLPETIGEERNWDYRFCWIRDASMIIRTLVNLRHHYVARRFFDFLLDVVPYKDDRIQIMYGIRGQKELTEHTLDWLDGYEGSRPVRVGNAAWSQQQNDIYGVLLDVLYTGFVLFREETSSLEALWTMTRGVVRHIEARWHLPDHGIWEIRGAPRHFTSSKVMCWVGLDRAVRIALLLGMEDYALAWAIVRDQVRADILEHGYNRQVGAFTQSYGSPHLDAANLLFWRLGFISADDPRWAATVRASYRELCRDGLMYRYKNADDFGEPTSSFLVCTFWMIQALHGIGEQDLARGMFEQVLTYTNHVGLLSEGLDFQTHRLLGNFPQGYSHLALVDTALLFEQVPRSADQRLEQATPLDLHAADPAREFGRMR
jgi:GH15 family glucan-1,4-alpha-glucosidase